MAKKGGSTTTTQSLDPQTQAMQKAVYGAAQQAADYSRAPGVDPLTKQAIGGYQNALGAGNLGLAAIQGDQNAFNSFLNPYTQNVTDAIASRWGDLAANTSNFVNQQATQAGAFGGSRHGIAEGTAIGDLNKDMTAQLAALQYQGFTDASARAAQAAGLGLGAAGELQNLGEYRRQVSQQQDPYLQRLAILKSGLAGTPYGTSQTQKQSGNFLNGLLGGISTIGGLGLFGPIGKALGIGGGGIPDAPGALTGFDPSKIAGIPSIQDVMRPTY